MQDDWADWSVGDIVSVNDGPGANQINISDVWPNPAYGDKKDPLIINVDPATGTAKLATNNVVFADYGQLTSAYIPSSGTNGYVFSCTGYIGLKIGLKYGSSDYGVYTHQRLSARPAAVFAQHCDPNRFPHQLNNRIKPLRTNRLKSNFQGNYQQAFR